MELSTIIKGVVANKLKKSCNGTEQDGTVWGKVKTAAEKLEHFKLLGVRTDGNFTTVVIGNNSAMWFGVSKRNPVDAYNAKRGECLAASRAVKDALEDLLAY